jgi:hypothetical protein
MLSRALLPSRASCPGLPHRNAQRVTFDPGDPAILCLTPFGAGVLHGSAHP